MSIKDFASTVRIRQIRGYEPVDFLPTFLSSASFGRLRRHDLTSRAYLPSSEVA
jgi:hypothetical protein